MSSSHGSARGHNDDTTPGSTFCAHTEIMSKLAISSGCGGAKIANASLNSMNGVRVSYVVPNVHQPVAFARVLQCEASEHGGEERIVKMKNIRVYATERPGYRLRCAQRPASHPTPQAPALTDDGIMMHVVWWNRISACVQNSELRAIADLIANNMEDALAPLISGSPCRGGARELGTNGRVATAKQIHSLMRLPR